MMAVGATSLPRATAVALMIAAVSSACGRYDFSVMTMGNITKVFMVLSTHCSSLETQDPEAVIAPGSFVVVAAMFASQRRVTSSRPSWPWRLPWRQRGRP